MKERKEEPEIREKNQQTERKQRRINMWKREREKKVEGNSGRKNIDTFTQKNTTPTTDQVKNNRKLK